MAGNFVLLKRVELTANAASITIDSFSTTGYTDLRIDGSFDCTAALNVGSAIVNVAINGSTANRNNRRLYGANTPGEDQGTGTGGAQTQTANGLANTFAQVSWYFPNHRSSNYKSYRIDAAAPNNSGTYWEHDAVNGLWSDTSAITSFTFTSSSGNFVAGTTISLYGLAAQGVTPDVAPKASGGSIIVNDGTYWYHAFLSSGLFIPQTTLTCNYLAIAGGGGGGWGSGGGGGGAGGLLASSASFTSSNNYAIEVGAGGSGAGNNLDASGFNGSDSVILGTGISVTAIGGGGGGSESGVTIARDGKTGGSGGGGCYFSAASPGSGTSGQGYAGGDGITNGTYYDGGGGGGAGGVGGNGTTNGTGGTGGAGVSTYSSWASATGTGVSGYYAGGGGGGGQTGSSGTAGPAGSGGAGSGGAYNGVAPTAGTANTGSGGGGGAFYGSNTADARGGTGGSGIVIIRYAMA